MPTDGRVGQSLSKTWPLWLSTPGKPSGSWSQAPRAMPPAHTVLPARDAVYLPGAKCSQPAQSLSVGIKLPANYLNSSRVDRGLHSFYFLGSGEDKGSRKGAPVETRKENTAQQGRGGLPGSWRLVLAAAPEGHSSTWARQPGPGYHGNLFPW